MRLEFRRLPLGELDGVRSGRDECVDGTAEVFDPVQEVTLAEEAVIDGDVEAARRSWAVALATAAGLMSKELAVVVPPLCSWLAFLRARGALGARGVAPAAPPAPPPPRREPPLASFG